MITPAQKFTTIPLVHQQGEFRYFAHIVPANKIYAEKFVITAMPDFTGECPKIVGWLVLMKIGEDGYVDWIEVLKEYRRRGIGRAMMKIAQKWLGNNELAAEGATADGFEFLKALGGKAP